MNASDQRWKWDLFTFNGGLGWPGAFGRMYWGEFSDFLRNYWDGSDVRDHFSDMEGLDIQTHIGSLFERKHEHGPVFQGKKGFISTGMGRSPRRYTATVYVPVEVWCDNQVEDTRYITYLVDGFDEAFSEIMRRALKIEGRLKQPSETERLWQEFCDVARAFKPSVPDPDIWERERRRAVRRNLIPNQFAD